MFKYFLIAAIMLYGPYLWCTMRKEPKEIYGLHWEIDGKGLLLVFFCTVFTLIPLTFVAVKWPGQDLPRTLALSSVLNYSAVGILAAIVEETFFRGWLQTIIRRNLSAILTILLVSLIFSLSHLFAATHWLRLATFFPGLVMGFLKERTGSIFPGILYHSLGNIWSIWFFPDF